MPARRALPMKKLAAVVLVSLTCLTILLPVVGSCNHSNIIPASPALYQADGWPMPPPIPPYNLATGDTTDSQLIADGWPMPPPIPPYNVSALA